MATAGDIYLSQRVRRVFAYTLINGNTLPVYEASWSYSVGAVPTANIRIRGPLPSYLNILAPITLWIGFAGGEPALQFTGQVVSRTAKPDFFTLECAGESRHIDKQQRIVFPWSGEIYAPGGSVGSAISASADGWIGYAMSQAGVTNWYAGLGDITISIPAYATFSSWAEFINQIATMLGSPFYELPSGQIRLEQLSPLPTGYSSRDYTTGDDGQIIDAEYREVLNDARNSVEVHGGQVDDPYGKNGQKATTQISYLLPGANWWSPEPDAPNGYIDGLELDSAATYVPSRQQIFVGVSGPWFDYSNSFIMTEALAALVASRFMSQLNLLPTQVRLTVSGDPDLYIGETVSATEPKTGISGNWFLFGYQSSLSASGFHSTLDLRNGPQINGLPGGGITSPRAPVASFRWSKWAVVLGASPANGDYGGGGGPSGGGLSTVIAFDASTSAGDIVSYAWSDTLGNSGSGRRFTVAYDPSTIATIVMTLLVTDSNGLTGSMEIIVNLRDADLLRVGGPLQVVDLDVAQGGDGSSSDDGADSWDDLTQGAAGVSGNFISVETGIAADSSTFVLFGTDAGEIVQNGSLVFTGASAITALHVDTVDAGLVWAGTDSGVIYRSSDYGATWELYNDFGDGFPVNQILTPAGGPLLRALVAVGGDTSDATTLVRFDANRRNSWAFLPITGSFLTAVEAAGAGYSAQAAVSNESAQGDLALLFSGGVSPVIWSTPTMLASSSWTAATGLSAAVGYSMVGGIGGVGDLLAIVGTHAYKAANGVVFSNVGTPPSQVHSLQWLGAYQVYLGAAASGVVATVDGGVHWGYVRANAGPGTAWPGGDSGKQLVLSSGPPISYERLIALADMSSYRDVAKLRDGGKWSELHNGDPAGFWGLTYLGAGAMIYLVSP